MGDEELNNMSHVTLTSHPQPLKRAVLRINIPTSIPHPSVISFRNFGTMFSPQTPPRRVSERDPLEIARFLQEQAAQIDLPVDRIRASLLEGYGTLEKAMQVIRGLEAENQASLNTPAPQIGVSH